MIYFILGVITGILLAFGAVVVGRKNEQVIERIIEKSVDLGGKAEILEPISSEVEALEEVFEENERKGRNTELKDVSD